VLFRAVECHPVTGRIGPDLYRICTGHLPEPLLVWHLVDLATPDRAAARGQPSTHTGACLVKLCPRVVVW
jgi:hypothetical protein